MPRTIRGLLLSASAAVMALAANAEQSVEERIAADFLGSGQGNELVSNSYSPRLRRAFVKYGNWLAGQEWSTFQNTSAIPESASFLILSDGMVFIRQPQIRRLPKRDSPYRAKMRR